MLFLTTFLNEKGVRKERVKMDNVRLYTRVSTDEQRRNGQSIEAQKEQLYEYCSKNDLNVLDYYEDNGFSGGTLKRPAFQKLLKDLRPNEVVLTCRLDRLTRSTVDGLSVINEWNDKNIGVKCIHDLDIDTTTANGKLILTVLLGLAANEREHASERINETFANKKKLGEPCSGCCAPGYKVEPKKVVVVPEESKMVKYAFDTFLATHSVSQTKVLFNKKYGDYLKEKEKRSNGRDAFTEQRMRYLLRNNNYVGNKTYPQIIEVPTFEAVQEILNERAGGKPRKYDYMFRGLLKCGYCGSTMVGAPRHDNGKLYLNYRCTSRSSERNKTCITISEKNIEKLLISQVHEDLTKCNVDLELENEIKVKKSDITKLEKKLERIKELYAEGDLTKQQFVDKKEKINDEINDIKRQLINSKRIKLDDNALNIYWKLSNKKKAVFWRSLIKEVRVYKGYVDIKYIGE